VGGEKNLLVLVAVDAFFRNRVAAGAQQLDPGRAAMVQFLRGRRLRCTAGHPELGRGGVVHQQEMALLVLHRHAGRKHSEDIPQDSQFGCESELAIAFGCGDPQVVLGSVLHAADIGGSSCSFG
jgi:hypothetical protein